jgi:hypothetical protein
LGDFSKISQDAAPSEEDDGPSWQDEPASFQIFEFPRKMARQLAWMSGHPTRMAGHPSSIFKNLAGCRAILERCTTILAG